MAALAEEAMTARIAGLLTLINDATSPGFGTSVDISFSYNSIAASTRVDGEMMYPWTDFFVSNDWRPLSDYSVLTAVEKQYMLEYVYVNKPYATVTELSQAVAQ